MNIDKDTNYGSSPLSKSIVEELEDAAYGSFSSSLNDIAVVLEDTFHRAVLDSNLSVVTSLLAKHPGLVKFADENGRNALHIATAVEDTNIILFLLSAGFDIDSKDSVYQRTCLYHCEEAEILKLLCEQGANPNTVDGKGNVPLHHYITKACNALSVSLGDGSNFYENQLQCISTLMRYGANPAIADGDLLQSPIHLAASLGEYNILSTLLSDSSVTHNLDQPDIDGNTALLLSASCEKEDGEQFKILMLLIDKGASAWIRNDSSESVLHLISVNKSLSFSGSAEPLLEMLLDLNPDSGLGIDVNCRDIDGCTPLIVACAAREWGLCRLLLQAGADLNLPCVMSSSFLQSGESSIGCRSRASSASSASTTIGPHFG